MPNGTSGPPPHFIVVVPGIMGSKLRNKSTGQIVWTDFRSIPLAPWRWDDWLTWLLKTMAYPNEALEPAGIVDDILFVPPWAKMEQYSRLLDDCRSWVIGWWIPTATARQGGTSIRSPMTGGRIIVSQAGSSARRSSTGRPSIPVRKPGLSGTAWAGLSPVGTSRKRAATTTWTGCS